MSLNIFWFLPTHGDGKYLGTSEGARAVDHGYLQQIAQAADRLGFGGVLIPTGRSCEDSWLVAASLIPVTQNLKFLVALRPGIISPTVAARQAATRTSWPATACTCRTRSATRPPSNSPASGAACWRARASTTTASTCR